MFTTEEEKQIRQWHTDIAGSSPTTQKHADARAKLEIWRSQQSNEQLRKQLLVSTLAMLASWGAAVAALLSAAHAWFS